MSKKQTGGTSLLIGKSHHAAIKEITDRITNAVENLYSDRPSDSNNKKSPPKSPTDANDSLLKLEDADFLDIDTTTWDMEASKQNVRNLLDSLKTAQRTRVMSELNQWFSDKSKFVQNDMVSLEKLEKERDTCEEALKTLHTEVETKLDEKEMHSFQVLHMFYRALHDIAKRKREQTNSGVTLDDATRQARLALGLGEDPGATLKDGIAAAEIDVQALRTELIAKEKEIAAALGALENGTENGTGPKASDLLLLISAQQDEINALGSRVELNEKKIKTLRSALSYLQGGTSHSEQPDEAVLAMIEEVKSKVRESRISELMARKEADDASSLRIPDEEEVLRLEADCVTLKDQLASLEDEIRKFQKPSEREQELREKLAKLQSGASEGEHKDGTETWIEEIKGETITIESAPILKKKLETELSRVQQENTRLQSQVANYEKLLSTGENTLKVMEQQRRLFVDAVEAARRALATQAVHAANAEVEADRIKVEEAESRLAEEKQLRQSRAAQDELLSSLRAEEAALLKEIQQLEVTLNDSHVQLNEEASRQDRVGNLIKQHATTLNNGSSGNIGEISADASNHAAELTRVQQQNDLLLQEIAELTNRLTAQGDETLLSTINNKKQEALGTTSGSNALSGPIVSSNNNSNNVKSNTTTTNSVKNPPTNLDSNQNVAATTATDSQNAGVTVVSTLAGLAKQIETIRDTTEASWAAADMEELLKLQQENYELARQIDLVERRIRLVKASKGNLDLSILREPGGVGDEDGADIPAENLELRKEVKHKQRTLQMLRKKWWAEKAAAEAAISATQQK